jgi:23S rRNA pseudouridine1911/1915/1917 synthase
MPDSHLLVLEVTEPTRFDLALSRALHELNPSLSRKRVKEWLATQSAIPLSTAEGRRLKVGAAFPLTAGKYHLPREWLSTLLDAKPATAVPDPRGCFLDILHESTDLLVLNKKSGVPTLPLSGAETGTAVNAALARAPELVRVGRTGLEPGLLHRLDTGTSGCLAFARTQAAYEHWRELWKTGQVRKIYRAQVTASATRSPLPIRAGQIIDLPLTADPSSRKRMRTYSKELAAQGARPLEARTEVLEVIPLRPGHLDVTVRITTGLRHQIRCHLAALGWPIDGDVVYHGQEVQRLMLHAWKLGLPGIEEEIVAPLPDEWATD